jgi:hypothetical protein
MACLRKCIGIAKSAKITQKAQKKRKIKKKFLN